MNAMTTPLDGDSETSAVAPAAIADDAIGALLVRAGKLKQNDLERVLKLQKEKNLRFGEAAVQLKLVSDQDIQKALATQYQYPYSSGSKGLDARLVAATEPFGALAETLRAVRAGLVLNWFSSGRKFLAVGSPTEAEGGNLLAANLAVLFAQLGKKTLLVDANLRKPTHQSLFKLPNGSGLAELLAGRAANMPVTTVQPFQTLSLLGAGSPPPNPSELLLRSPLEHMFEEAADNFDVVIVDTPPADLSSDFQIVAARAGGLLIATKKHLTRLQSVADMKAKTEAAGATVVGAVMMA